MHGSSPDPIRDGHLATVPQKNQGVAGSYNHQLRPDTPVAPALRPGPAAPVRRPGARGQEDSHRIRSWDLGWEARKNLYSTKGEVLGKKEKRNSGAGARRSGENP